MPEISLLCHAKINLTLEILRRREDGYHDLATVFQAVSLHDELRVRLEAGDEDKLAVSGITVPVEGNLVLRAAAAYRRETGLGGGVRLALHKQIPLGAGLGGGSSDAAGTLVGLESLTPGPSPLFACGKPAGEGSTEDGRLATLAAGLGSDVAFFLGAGTALGEGRGEVLEPLPTPTGWLVLAKPKVGVSTAVAYALLSAEDFTDGSRTRDYAEGLRAGYGLHEMACGLYNGFAAPIERRWPQIRVLREQLLALGAANALMTGSGAAVFGIFANQAASETAAAQLTAEGYWAVAVCPVVRGLTRVHG